MIAVLSAAVWSLEATVVVYLINPNLFLGLESFLALATVLTGAMFVGDILCGDYVTAHSGTLYKVGMWFVLYECLPAAAIFGYGRCDYFNLPDGVFTAFAMCAPMSVFALRELVRPSGKDANVASTCAAAFLWGVLTAVILGGLSEPPFFETRFGWVVLAILVLSASLGYLVLRWVNEKTAPFPLNLNVWVAFYFLLPALGIIIASFKLDNPLPFGLLTACAMCQPLASVVLTDFFRAITPPSPPDEERDSIWTISRGR